MAYNQTDIKVNLVPRTTNLNESQTVVKIIVYTIDRQFVDGEIKMVKAYVMIKAVSGMESEVLRELNEIHSMEEVHAVFGAFDIVAEIRAKDMETIIDVITDRIRKIKGIIDTNTLLVIDVDVDITSTGLAS